MSGLPIPHGRQLCLNSFSTFFLNSGLAALPQLYLPTLDLQVAFFTLQINYSTRLVVSNQPSDLAPFVSQMKASWRHICETLAYTCINLCSSTSF